MFYVEIAKPGSANRIGGLTGLFSDDLTFVCPGVNLFRSNFAIPVVLSVVYVNKFCN